MAALLALLAGGCTTHTVYQPYNYEKLHAKTALMLEPVYLEPLPRALHARIISEVEDRFARFPHLGAITTREAFQARIASDRNARRAYTLLSDSLSVVGIADRENAQILRRAAGVELLLMVQIVYVPCDRCEQGSQFGFVGTVVEAASGEVAWRTHMLSRVFDEAPEALAELAEDLVDEFFLALEPDLRPKWQRLRFATLGGARPRAATP